MSCTAAGRSATAGQPPAIVDALARSDHAALLSAEERALLTRWLDEGAPGTAGGVHSPRYGDPRLPEGHASTLRASRYRPMLDAADVDACGKCHQGAPNSGALSGAPGRVAAPGATACTSCHSREGGPLACGTCHGDGDRASPPKNSCGAAPSTPRDSHRAHVNAGATQAEGRACKTCHPVPPTFELAGAHGDGHVEVWLDETLAGRGATFDPASKRCAGSCHARGGNRETPAWGEASVGCNDCHRSPPASHYDGPCRQCHHEVAADGASLTQPVRLHLNGRIDLGDGSGQCGACHGSGDDPWPTTGAHTAHAKPSSSRPVACATCHVIPVGKHPVGAGAVVRLAGPALAGGARARYDAATKTCSETACHTGVGGSLQTPAWNSGPAARACGACHATPPPPPHAAATQCGGSICHSGLTSGFVGTLSLTPAGAKNHVDGRVNR
ncbi:MAG: CxxxxCH/CxxCH domain-containing protein [Myxococcales bacterium]|nr:CxxxxCH/CxxCH domain-containing protein [Myxococcales bacterium]